MSNRQQMSEIVPLTYRKYDAMASAEPAKRAFSGSIGGESPRLAKVGGDRDAKNTRATRHEEKARTGARCELRDRGQEG